MGTGKKKSHRLHGLSPNKNQPRGSTLKRKGNIKNTKTLNPNNNNDNNKYDQIKGLGTGVAGAVFGMGALFPLIKDLQGVTRFDRTKPGPYIPKQFNPENVGSRMLFKNMIRVQGNNNTSYQTECNHPTNPGQCRFIKKGEPNVVHKMRESRVDNRQDVIERAHKGAPLYNQYIHIHIPNGFISPDYTTYTVPLKMNLIMHAGAGNTVKYENSLENGRGVFARNKAKMLKHELPFTPHLVHNGGEPVVNTQFNIRQGNKTKFISVYDFRTGSETNITNKIIPASGGLMSLKSIMWGINKMYKGSKKMVVFSGSREIKIPKSRMLLSPGDMPDTFNRGIRTRTFKLNNNNKIVEEMNRTLLLASVKPTHNNPTKGIFGTKHAATTSAARLEQTFGTSAHATAMASLYKSELTSVNSKHNNEMPNLLNTKDKNQFIPHEQRYDKIIYIQAHGVIAANAKTYTLPRSTNVYMLSQLGSSTQPDNIELMSRVQFNHMKKRVGEKKPIFNREALKKGAFIAGGHKIVDTNIQFVPHMNEKVFVKVLHLNSVGMGSKSNHQTQKPRDEDITNKLLKNANNKISTFSQTIKDVSNMYSNKRLLFVTVSCRPFIHKALSQLFPTTLSYLPNKNSLNSEIEQKLNFTTNSRRTSTRGMFPRWFPQFIQNAISPGINQDEFNQSIDNAIKRIQIEKRSMKNSKTKLSQI